MPGFEWPVYKSSGMVKSGKVRSECVFLFLREKGKECAKEGRKNEGRGKDGSERELLDIVVG